MKKVIVLASVAGIASMAAAQSASISIVPSASTFDWTMTNTFTLSIYATADFGTHIAGGEFALDGTNCADVHVSNMTASAASWGALGENDRGYAGNGDHNGLVFGQLIFPPFIMPSVDSSIVGGASVLLGIVEVTVDGFPHSGVSFDWDSIAGQGAFTLEIFDSADGSFTQLTSVNHGSASVLCIPAPSSFALLGLGGLIAGRRHR